MLGVVCAEGVHVAPSAPELCNLIDELLARRAREDFPPEDLKNAVRSMLRAGGYKPSGRGKPASEYLAHAAREGKFPRINNLVDINNYISLLSGLPVSLLDRSECGEQALVRCGGAGEKYVFNPAGQEIDLEGLICVCRAQPLLSVPLGTPVKDSMQGKIKEHSRAVLGVIYAPAAIFTHEDLELLAQNFASLLSRYAGAVKVESAVA